MIPKWKYILWPLTWLISLKHTIRNRLFDLGIWKSVAFEFPVVFVGSIGGEQTINISRYVQSLLKSALHLQLNNETKEHLVKNEKKKYHYFSAWTDRSEAAYGFTTSHRVLGISEYFQSFPNVSSIVMDGLFSNTEIRPQLRILVTDFQSSFNINSMWPVGSLRSPKIEASLADILLVTETPNVAEHQEKKMELQKYLNPSASIFFIKNTTQSLNAFNSSDKIEFIKDRDNFERLILNVLPNTNLDSE